MPYVQLLADFREEVRNVAREEKGKTNFIQIEPSIYLSGLGIIEFNNLINSIKLKNFM